MVPLHPADTSGVLAVRGRIDGAKVIAYCTDATKMGGAMGTEGCRHIVEAIDTAVRERRPVIGLWHSGGARLAEGVEALDGVGQVFAAMVRASGRVPQISVVLGAAAGGAAYGPALTDIVIMAPEGRVFVTGPDVVRSRHRREDRHGGPRRPERARQQSGVVHVVANSEADALRTGPADHRPVRPARHVRPAGGARRRPTCASCCRSSRNRAYDVRPLMRAHPDDRTGDGRAASSRSCSRSGRRTSSSASAGSAGAPSA